MSDQAERLRQVAAVYMAELRKGSELGTKRARVLAVTSGKGGVGKTNLSVNLAYALQTVGRQVILLDADLGLANVDVLLGTAPRLHLGDLLLSGVDIVDLLYEAPGGLKLIAGGSGLEGLANLEEPKLHRFIGQMRKLERQTDLLLIDTAAGLGREVTSFLFAADTVLLVATPEPTAMTDAYAVAKLILRRNPSADIKMVLNQVENEDDAEEAAHRFSRALLAFMGSAIDYIGAIPRDRAVTQAVRTQRPFILGKPNAPASMAIFQIARRLIGEDGQERVAPSLFFDRLLRVVRKLR
jgi:flagellar biosynthesis protein FlhG